MLLEQQNEKLNDPLLNYQVKPWYSSGCWYKFSVWLTLELPWLTKREFLLTILSGQVMRRKKISIWELSVDPIPNSPNQNHKIVWSQQGESLIGSSDWKGWTMCGFHFKAQFLSCPKVISAAQLQILFIIKCENRGSFSYLTGSISPCLIIISRYTDHKSLLFG